MLLPPACTPHPPHPSFLIPLSFPPGGCLKFLSLISSIISLGPRPPLFVCSASVGSLCSLVLEPTTASFSREVRALVYACVCELTIFLQTFFSHTRPSLCLLARPPSVRLALKWSQDLAMQGWQKTGKLFYHLLHFLFVCLKEEVANTYTQRLAHAEMSDLFFIRCEIPDTHSPSPRFF